MSILSKKAAIERWATSDGKLRRKQIINNLINHVPLETLPFIQQVDGYYDLRGLSFDNKTNLKYIEMKNVDFSYSSFNCLILHECRIENVVFDMCDCTEMLQYNCCFEECRFKKSKFLNAGFGIDGGKYINSIFEESNFKGALFFYPDFYECTFKNCMMDGVDFSASHFNKVRFVGRLEDVWFRGESPKPGVEKVLNEKSRGLNPMIIDFSEADLWFITYSDNCDLSRVIMPRDGNHYLIRNFKKVIRLLAVDAEKMTDTKAQKFVLEFIEMFKYHVVKQDMVILNLINIISNAEYYLGKDSPDYCKSFIEKLIIFSNV